MLVIFTFWINIANSIQTEGNPSGNKRVGLEDCVGLSVYLLSTWPQLVLEGCSRASHWFLVGFHYFCATGLGNLISLRFKRCLLSPHHNKMANNRNAHGVALLKLDVNIFQSHLFYIKHFSFHCVKLNAQFTVIADLAINIWKRGSRGKKVKSVWRECTKTESQKTNN